uniref:Photosynthetic NDH subcomplex B 2 n=1 Tax=Habenaria pantlingiana TaxID=1498489 RepID=A0A0F7GZ07_9ASPA
MASHSLLSLQVPKPSPPPLLRASSTTAVQCPPQSLEERFGRKGIKFSDSDVVPAVELTVRNGSSLKLRIPDGIITSYRPKVYWKDDGFEEVFHTIGDGDSSVKGGLGLILNDVSQDGSPWSASEWVVKDSDSDSIDAVQVELSCTNGDGSLDITYVVSLYPISISTAVIVQNNGTKPTKLASAMLSHIRFKNRGGSAIQGLQGCSYCSHPPLASSFSILSPSDAMEPDPPGWFSFFDSPSQEKVSPNIDEPEAWKVEDDMYTVLKRKFSRVYAAPPSERRKRIYNTSPSKYQTIDQGSKLGFRVIRMGYEDIYIGTPGALSLNYGKNYFICTGPASMLVPVILEPGDQWRAAQVIEHDNL